MPPTPKPNTPPIPAFANVWSSSPVRQRYRRKDRRRVRQTGRKGDFLDIQNEAGTQLAQRIRARAILSRISAV